ncbi:TPA: hypothetical protein EYP66_00780 [Candidatus Poribacteria bacterium]|nr:hypothetical protein [Candidatus Poribacteria bacterium]
MQITIGADNIGGDIDNPKLGGTGGGRDHKLIWSKNDPDDRSWTSSSPYGDLIFVGPITAVSQKGKVATAWGTIKCALD